jgi:radical SAM superfamily enzyme YgiQ (UPF0313 family)
MARRTTELQRFVERTRGEQGPVFTPGHRRVAMAYPSPYRAAMSSLGYQRITMLMREAGLAAERCFLPEAPDTWRAQRQPPVSSETLTPLGKFPLVAVSLAYELEITGLITLLELAGIPALREERGPEHPAVLLGGPITMASPLAAAPFVDAMLLGEAEDTAPKGAAAFFDAESRSSWLAQIAALPGGYVPELHGSQIPSAAQASPLHLPAVSSWLCPDAELSSMFLIEGERGCHRQCTFCVMRRGGNLGGMRLVRPDTILGLVPDEARKVGLVGAAISDHPQLVHLLEVLVGSGRQVSLSSLRADRIMRRPKVAELLRKSGARTLTVASDGASRRMRKSIMKGTTEEHLLACASQAHEHGYRTLKVYMMVGLPGEEDADIDELIAFTAELAKVAAPCRVALGVAPFVAKRNTPLDGVDFAGIKLVEARLKRLTRGLKGRAEVRPVSARWAWVEHQLSQHGPECGLAVYRAHKDGGRFVDHKRHLQALDATTFRPWARAAAK